MAPGDEIWPALSYYALNQSAVRQIEPIGSGGGWSGSRLWKLAIADGRTLCLRRWPEEHPTEDRLRLIHRVVQGVEAGGIRYVPAPLLTVSGATFIEHAGHLWELARWLPGQADFHKRPSAARLQAAMRALADFHQAAARDPG